MIEEHMGKKDSAEVIDKVVLCDSERKERKGCCGFELG